MYKKIIILIISSFINFVHFSLSLKFILSSYKYLHIVLMSFSKFFSIVSFILKIHNDVILFLILSKFISEFSFMNSFKSGINLSIHINHSLKLSFSLSLSSQSACLASASSARMSRPARIASARFLNSIV